MTGPANDMPTPNELLLALQVLRSELSFIHPGHLRRCSAPPAWGGLCTCPQEVRDGTISAIIARLPERTA